MELALTIHVFYYRAKELNGSQLKELFTSMLLHVWDIEKVAFKCSFSSPQTHARARTHTYTCTQTCRPLFEVSTQTRTLMANLEGMKSRRLSSVLSWFPSLHGTAKSRISKACPEVTGCLLGFPRSASHMPEDSRRPAVQGAVCSSSSQSAGPSPRSPPRSWSSWKIEPTWGGSQNRKDIS